LAWPQARGAPSAARLFGAVDALLETTGGPVYIYTPNPAIRERAVMAARRQFGEDDWAVTWGEGALSLE
jgi:hypothetical protein